MFIFKKGMKYKVNLFGKYFFSIEFNFVSNVYLLVFLMNLVVEYIINILGIIFIMFFI